MSNLLDRLRAAWESMEEAVVGVVDKPLERRYSFVDAAGVELLSASVSDLTTAPAYVREKFQIPEKDVFQVMLAFGQWLAEEDSAGSPVSEEG